MELVFMAGNTGAIRGHFQMRTHLIHWLLAQNMETQIRLCPEVP